jgi:histidyl-tRNA synthetase
LQRNPIRALDSKDENIKKILKDVKKIKEFFNKEQKEKFQDIQIKLLDAGVDFKINENLVRGLDYYTGTVFEYISSELGAQNAILGGGRYDNLIENLGGKNLPATGFALGIDRLSEIINKPMQSGGLFIGSMDAESKSFAQKIAYQLRKNSSDLKIETYLGNANLSKQIKKADSQSFKFVMIVGQEEQKSLKFKLKDLELNKSFELSEKELLEYFSG